MSDDIKFVLIAVVAVIAAFFILRAVFGGKKKKSSADFESRSPVSPSTIEHAGQGYTASRPHMSVDEVKVPVHRQRYSSTAARRRRVSVGGHTMRVAPQYDYYYDYDADDLQDDYYMHRASGNMGAALAALAAGAALGYFADDAIELMTGGQEDLDDLVNSAGSDALEFGGEPTVDESDLEFSDTAAVAEEYFSSEPDIVANAETDFAGDDFGSDEDFGAAEDEPMFTDAGGDNDSFYSGDDATDDTADDTADDSADFSDDAGDDTDDD